MKRVLIITAICVTFAAAGFAVDIGKGWKATFSKGDGQKENVLPIIQLSADGKTEVPLPVAKPGGGKWFFPHGGGHVNYITRRAEVAKGKKFMVLRFKMIGTGKFKGLDPAGTGACIHPYIEEGFTINGWWADYAYSIILDEVGDKGMVTLKVPLDPSKWGNIQGQNGASSAETRQKFASVIAHLGHVGVSFGCCEGGCYGHGVKAVQGNPQGYIIGVTFE